ncbi:SIS domain-containing protein [uncultured Aquabacterium sp.]|uniref:D-sedoheptulose-7-phosphate isomerase n=1 Tax=Aquabacterium sp. TaxID=1872578 RepID=UPI0025F4967E|nr:D-sedoheptulose 7-phosphate isomerase [uncultured Aquabacterium sp.]
MGDRLKALASRWLAESVTVKQQLAADEAMLDQALEVAQRCAAACSAGHKVLFMGNGGSAADAQHLAGEFVSRFNYDRPGLASFALTVDTSVLTAIGNDYGYDKVFERQVQACARPGDVVVGLSTSGNSVNVIKGLEMARTLGACTVALTGQDGGRMKSLADICLRMPSSETPRIQECHIVVGHIICGLVEQIVFPRA